MNADQIKRQRVVRRSYSSESTTVRLAQVQQRHAPSRSKSFELVGRTCRVIQTRPALEREISGLGMEDPVVAKQRRNSRGIKLGGVMEETMGGDESCSLSIASDPTANEENELLDIALFQASLSMGDSSGLLSESGFSTSCSGHLELDDDENETMVQQSSHFHRSKSDIAKSLVSSSPHHAKPELILPPGMEDLQAFMKSMNRSLDFAIFKPRRSSLKSATSKSSRNQQSLEGSSNGDQQEQLALDVSPVQVKQSPPAGSMDRAILDSGMEMVIDDAPTSPVSPQPQSCSPRRSKRTVRKLRVVGNHAANSSISLEHMANVCSVISHRE
ncbi:hypothetical protein MPSEU_000107300 [Mayamaea pseudoterrestris]|nr:hypothetical protein MPSEU_000107300 [Mayamaea pseudoterrestris]